MPVPAHHHCYSYSASTTTYLPLTKLTKRQQSPTSPPTFLTVDCSYSYHTLTLSHMNNTMNDGRPVAMRHGIKVVCLLLILLTSHNNVHEMMPLHLPYSYL